MYPHCGGETDQKWIESGFDSESSYDLHSLVLLFNCFLSLLSRFPFAKFLAEVVKLFLGIPR